MSLTTESMTPADIAAVTRNNNNGGLFGGDNGAWFLIILFLFAFAGGWGNNGWGGAGGGNITENYVLSSDFATIQRQLSDGFASMERKGDSISNGLCDGFYAQNTTMLNGFNGVNTAVLNGTNNVTNAVMNGTNAIQSQLAQCCCDNKSAIADVKYAMAMNANATDRAIGDGFAQTNFAIQNQHNAIERQVERGFADTNYNMATNTCQTLQAIDKVGDRVIEWMANRETQNLRDENNALRLAASQQAQNNYLINELRQYPRPAYVVPNPYAATCNCCCNS